MSGDKKSAWLGLGGNIGDVIAAMAAALQLLDEHAEIEVAAVSPVYKTPPWGVTDQPWFLNCCAEITTGLSPEDLLETCQEAERAGKRERKIRWGPRTIDIDILVFEGVEQVEQRLTIPHPRMLERAFVLVPLADIAPDLILDGQTCAERAQIIEGDGIERVNSTGKWWR